MKNLLVSTALIATMTGAASAQMVFEGADLSLGYNPSLFGSEIDSFSLDGRVDYTLGQIGLQFDGSSSFITDYSEFISEFSAGVHVYKELNSGAKVGGFIAIDVFGGDLSDANQLTKFGIEGIVSFNALDIEASISSTSSSNSSSALITTALDAYYAISPAIELSAGVSLLTSSSNTYEYYRVGASYTLANMPLTIGASYVTVENEGDFSFNLSYAFGAPTGERLFRQHNYPFIFGG